MTISRRKLMTTGGKFVRHNIRFDTALRRHLRARMRKPQDIDDLAQEVWRRLMQLSYHGRIRNPLGLIIQTAEFVLKDYYAQQLRADNTTVPIDDIEESELSAEFASTNPFETVCSEKTLRAILDGLRPDFRAILVMRIVHGLDYGTIGDRFHFTRGTATQYFFKALTLAREQWRALESPTHPARKPPTNGEQP